MKYFKFFWTKLPLLSLVVTLALIARVAGLVEGVRTTGSVAFLKAPSYATLLDSASQAMTLHGSTEKAAAEQTEVEEPEEEEDDALPEGYLSADEEARLTGKTLAEVVEARRESSDGAYIYAEEFPEEATRPVVQAVDYGIANPAYIDEDGTTYDYIDEGIFAQNHDYYSLREVDDDYFADALFIGDSRTDGLYRYGDMRNTASFFALESITIYNVFDVRIPFHQPGEDDVERSLEEVLSQSTFGKIYLAPGMNELGVPDTTTFREQYRDVIERINELQPDAILFIEGIIHVNIDRSAGDDIFNNKVIVQRNEAIAKLANGHDIFYVDPNEALCDESGNLVYAYTNDGIHLTAQYYPLWHAYLNRYGIVRGEADGGRAVQ